jgi:DNA-binding IclR family transcriptional regulator
MEFLGIAEAAMGHHDLLAAFAQNPDLGTLRLDGIMIDRPRAALARDGAPGVGGGTLPAWTHALIAELSAETGETAAIAAPSGTMAVFIDVVEPSAPIRYFAQIGHRIPIHATSSGRALLLQYAPEERDALYRKIEFKQYGPSTPISIDAVETELRASIDRGYCQSFADYSRDLAGVAIPLPIGDRRLSVVVAGPEFRIGSRTFDVAATLKKFADRHRQARMSEL